MPRALPLLCDDLAMVCTGIALLLFWWGCRLMPAHDPLFVPWRWLLHMAMGGLAVLLLMDIIDDLEVWWAPRYVPEIRKLVYRSWVMVQAGGFLLLYRRCVRQVWQTKR